MSHRQAVWAMVAAAMMWSIAGVVTRHLESARGFEVTFWRSLFNALALLGILSVMRTPRVLWHSLRTGGRAMWVSAVCWATMYTAFMMALSLAPVANVLVTMALAPVFTALSARLAIGHRLPPRTWGAIVVAGVGIVWMYAADLKVGDSRYWLGMLVALAVPVAAAVNWTLMQYGSRAAAQRTPDMLPAVLLGAALSALVTLPMAVPFAAGGRDLGLLCLLGVVQLAVPCLLATRASQRLSAPEVSLLALLEVIFGVLWVWWGASEAPSNAVLVGGMLVLGALAANETLALRQTEVRS